MPVQSAFHSKLPSKTRLAKNEKDIVTKKVFNLENSEAIIFIQLEIKRDSPTPKPTRKKSYVRSLVPISQKNVVLNMCKQFRGLTARAHLSS